ncbi:IS1096 element passenger TnpR family protein [Pseudofulvibacter geojedonensis]|uniref:Plasmid pRiA4b Orf3-like domain-containing protein n=1 Tax=Pseudofulvibacter geojedonensis TaxID=1123758 RepID=A0ABW3I309_9FLAO
MIYRFRVILDADEDVFRDIEIEASATAEDFHNTITQAFGFEGGEMASFYISDEEWNQGEEIALFDMSEGMNPVRVMCETSLDDITNEDSTKLIYVYDFFNMWTFLVELAEIAEPIEGATYPNLMFAHGILPESPPEKEFKSDEEDSLNFEDDFEDLDIDSFDDFNNSWN